MFFFGVLLVTGALAQDLTDTPSTKSPADQCFRICPFIYMPLCDSNGQTHASQCTFEEQQCLAKAKGEVVPKLAYTGECKTETKLVTKADCMKACNKIFDPVCGSNGNTYGNPCLFEIAQCEAKVDGKVLTIVDSGPCQTTVAGSSSTTAGPVNPKLLCRKLCHRMYDPVCGSDKKTYGNACVLEVAVCEAKVNGTSLSFAYDGPCKSVKARSADSTACPMFCPMIYKPVCGTDGNTYSNACDMQVRSCRAKENGLTEIQTAYEGRCIDCSFGCGAVYKPVCGNNGQTYGNECELKLANCASTKQGLAGIKLDYSGECKN